MNPPGGLHEKRTVRVDVQGKSLHRPGLRRDSDRPLEAGGEVPPLLTETLVVSGRNPLVNLFDSIRDLLHERLVVHVPAELCAKGRHALPELLRERLETHVRVESDPTDKAKPRAVKVGLPEDAPDLLPADQEVVGPLEPGVGSERPYRPRHGDAEEQVEEGKARRVQFGIEEERKPEPARRRAPRASHAPASCGLLLSDDDRARGDLSAEFPRDVMGRADSGYPTDLPPDVRSIVH